MNPALNSLTPYFQYQFNNQKEIVGAEILMRSNLGVISDVVEILNEQNKVHHLDIAAFNWAIKFKEKNKNLDCSSNVASKSLLQKEFTDYLYILDPMCTVKLELTENRLFKNSSIKSIYELKQFGFKFSLDDYGSGFNGLNRLSTLPLSEVKIDRYLINLLPNSKAIAIISNTIQLIKKLGMSVVAEGVESSEQWQILKDLGCDRFQGFYLHKPEPFTINN